MRDDTLIARVRAVRDWILANADEPVDGAIKAHLAGWSDDDQIARWLDLYRNGVAAVIPGFEGSVGIDFGCWSGLGSWVLSMLGPRRVVGVELNRDAMRFGRRWASHFGLDTVNLMWDAGGIIPFQNATADWVYVNQVFCNMQPDQFEQATAEIARVIRPGGSLVFCDSNNPHCPDTPARLERVYRTRELGDGDQARPAGVLFNERKRRIKELAADLDDITVDRLARNTCYLGGPQLDRAVLAFLHAGVKPASPFLGGWQFAPVNPLTGMAAGNVTDPYYFAARFDQLGFDVSINNSCAPGPSDPAAVYELLCQSQGFYIIGRKRP